MNNKLSWYRLRTRGYFAFRYFATKPSLYLTTFMGLNMLGFYWMYNANRDVYSVIVSKWTQSIAETSIPHSLRSTLFKLYGNFYSVNFDEIKNPLNQFNTFSQFFCRQIKERKTIVDQNIILSPADSKILSISQIKTDSCFLIKGINYSLGELLTGEEIKLTEDQIGALKKNKQNKLFQIIFYLGPGDYHRYHSPAKLHIVNKFNIKGSLYSVNQKSLRKYPKVYEKNQRKLVEGRYFGGYMNLIMIGAFNVGNIIIHKKQQFVQGEEMGMFKLGSTIVLILQLNSNTEWIAKQGQKIKYGEIVCKMGQ